MVDQYKATWVSHSSIGDFLRCPKAYYYRSVYKDLKSGHRITEMKPALALGQAVHEVIDQLAKLPQNQRLSLPLEKRLKAVWEKVAGIKGGFKTKSEEKESYEKGRDMLNIISNNPGPIVKKAIKIKGDNSLLWYWFDKEEEIILCGKIDWVEYVKEKNAINIIDFKTGNNLEEEGSLQLPIYLLLAENIQKRKVNSLFYWYLNKSKKPIRQKMPDKHKAYEKILAVAKRIKLARQINYFKCPKGGCYACRPLERIVHGEGKMVGVSEYKQDIYVL